MEAKEKRVSAYTFIVLLTAVFLLLLFLHAPRAATKPWSIETQREASGKTAPLRRKIDVNTASAEELETLTGVGAAIAREIVKEREENGAFENLEDLLRVKGIGESKLEGFRYEVTIGGEK